MTNLAVPWADDSVFDTGSKYLAGKILSVKLVGLGLYSYFAEAMNAALQIKKIC